MESDSEIRGELQSLPPIEWLNPDGAGKQLLAQIDEFASEVNTLRDQQGGLSPDVVHRIEQKLLADRVRHTATIEGSTLDRRETLHVLTTGQIIEGKVRPSEEVKNLGIALNYSAKLVSKDVLREFEIRSIHKLLLDGLDRHAGQYRPHDVRITNATYRPPEHIDVPRLMSDLVQNLHSAESSGSTHPFIIGVYGHWCMARIHPFVDGNGRMARILQDLCFLRGNLVPTPIPFQQVDDYYEALQLADAGQPRAFFELVATAMLASLQKYRAAIEEERVRKTDDWLDDLIENAKESVKDQESVLFTRYMQRIGEFRETVGRVCHRLSEGIPDISIRLRTFGGIDLSQFRQIRINGKAAKTWDFGIECSYGGLSAKVVFWHGRYFPGNEDESFGLSNYPVLLLSLYDGDTYRTLDDLGDQTISLRALHAAEGTLDRIRENPVTEGREIDRDISPAEVAKDFMQEFLRSKLRIG